jgi:hypothetical protein
MHPIAEAGYRSLRAATGFRREAAEERDIATLAVR